MVGRQGSGITLGEADDYAVTVRITSAPWYHLDEEEGPGAAGPSRTRIFHIGLSMRLQGVKDLTRFKQRPESYLAPNLIDTGSFPAQKFDVLGLESVLVLGPLSFQGQYLRARIDSEETLNPRAYAYYVYASYILTGESRPYNTSTAAFGRIRPRSPVAPGFAGWGAWEVAARFSQADFNDKALHGGHLTDLTFGLNWYLTRPLRITLNYVRAYRQDLEPFGIFQTRFQVGF
jgi:phosphate-selective porin OprO/OprP